MGLLAFAVIIAIAYAVSDIIWRWMGVGSLSWGSRRNPKIALTFDDGPSEHTQAILELLARHQIRATFFLTTSRAEAYPQLVEAIKSRGHQVEAHGYWHRPAVLMMPWTEWVHIHRSPGKLYRPPMGIHSPFTRLFATLLGKKVALWDLESQDWLDKDPKALCERMISYLKPGSVVLLHDRYARTLRLLDLFVPRITELGYQPTTLDDLGCAPLSFRRGLQRALQGFDERYFRRHQAVRAGLKPFSMLRIEKHPFPGPAIPEFPVGTPAILIHIESPRVSELDPLEVLRTFRQTLREVAEHVAADPEVKLVYGHSSLAQGGALFGLKTVPLSGVERMLANLGGAWFVWLYRGHLPKKTHQPAQLAYISREELLKRFWQGAAISSPEASSPPNPPAKTT